MVDRERGNEAEEQRTVSYLSSGSQEVRTGDAAHGLATDSLGVRGEEEGGLKMSENL